MSQTKISVEKEYIENRFRTENILIINNGADESLILTKYRDRNTDELRYKYIIFGGNCESFNSPPLTFDEMFHKYISWKIKEKIKLSKCEARNKDETLNILDKSLSNLRLEKLSESFDSKLNNLESFDSKLNNFESFDLENQKQYLIESDLYIVENSGFEINGSLILSGKIESSNKINDSYLFNDRLALNDVSTDSETSSNKSSPFCLSRTNSQPDSVSSSLNTSINQVIDEFHMLKFNGQNEYDMDTISERTDENNTPNFSPLSSGEISFGQSEKNIVESESSIQYDSCDDLYYDIHSDKHNKFSNNQFENNSVEESDDSDDDSKELEENKYANVDSLSEESNNDFHSNNLCRAFHIDAQCENSDQLENLNDDSDDSNDFDESSDSNDFNQSVESSDTSDSHSSNVSNSSQDEKEAIESYNFSFPANGLPEIYDCVMTKIYNKSNPVNIVNKTINDFSPFEDDYFESYRNNLNYISPLNYQEICNRFDVDKYSDVCSENIQKIDNVDFDITNFQCKNMKCENDNRSSSEEEYIKIQTDSEIDTFIKSTSDFLPNVIYQNENSWNKTVLSDSKPLIVLGTEIISHECDLIEIIHPGVNESELIELESIELSPIEIIHPEVNESESIELKSIELPPIELEFIDLPPIEIELKPIESDFIKLSPIEIELKSIPIEQPSENKSFSETLTLERCNHCHFHIQTPNGSVHHICAHKHSPPARIDPLSISERFENNRINVVDYYCREPENDSITNCYNTNYINTLELFLMLLKGIGSFAEKHIDSTFDTLCETGDWITNKIYNIVQRLQ